MEVELNISKNEIKRNLKDLASISKRLVVTTICDVMKGLIRQWGKLG